MGFADPDDGSPLSLFAPEAGSRMPTSRGTSVGDALPPLLRFNEERPAPSGVPAPWGDAEAGSEWVATALHPPDEAAADQDRRLTGSLWAEIRRRAAAISAHVAASANDADLELPVRGATIVGPIREHAVDTSVQLDQTTTAFKALKHSIASALSEATYLAELVTALEKRTAKLTENDRSLRHAHGTVWRLEQRAIKTTAQLRHVIRTTIQLERALALRRDAADDVVDTVRERVAAAARPRGLRDVGISATGVFIALAVGSAMIAAPSHDPARTAIETPRASTATLPFSVLSSRVWRLEVGTVRIPGIVSTIKTADGVQAAAIDSDRRSLKPARIVPGQGPDTSVHAAQVMRPEVFTGDLEIESDPAGAIVLIDRRRVGTTPLQLRNVRVGSHVVWIERDGYRRWTRVVTVSAETKVQLRSDLEPER